jgi:NAD(P)-dependent dehydrogenase (short-subunit alcohol dehydrogenase family)
MGGVKDKVVVITGASAGIGRSTALEFAERGASVVLVARRAEALDDLARECEDAGGRALAAPADVTDEEALRDVVRRSVERFGRIDVWVNNAAVSAFGRFEEVPSDVYRRVIETNLFGYVNGARAALAQFHEQGRGVLINVSSVVGVGAIPYTNSIPHRRRRSAGSATACARSCSGRISTSAPSCRRRSIRRCSSRRRTSSGAAPSR